MTDAKIANQLEVEMMQFERFKAWWSIIMAGSCAAILPVNRDKYIARINRENFAGYNNWRLPTLHEAKFLLEPKKNEANNLYIDSIFNKRQNEILTSDFSNVHECWVINFDGGICDDACCDWFIHVRAVR